MIMHGANFCVPKMQLDNNHSANHRGKDFASCMIYIYIYIYEDLVDVEIYLALL